MYSMIVFSTLFFWALNRLNLPSSSLTAYGLVEHKTKYRGIMIMSLGAAIIGVLIEPSL